MRVALAALLLAGLAVGVWLVVGEGRSKPAVETDEVALALADSRAGIIGRVSLNGEPVDRECRVFWSNERAGSTRPDAAGVYRFEDVEPGTVHLVAVLGERSGELGREEVELHLTSGEVRRHDFDLWVPLDTISGRFVGPPDVALPGAVFAEAGDLSLRALVDADGAFAFEVPDRHRAYDVSTYYANELLVEEDVAPGTTDLEIRVPRVGVLRFRALAEATGRPASGYDVSWRRDPSESFRGGGLRRRHAADQDGWYQLELPEGPLDVRFAPGLMAALAPLEASYLPQTVSDLEIRAATPTVVEVVLSKGAAVTVSWWDDVAPDDPHIVVLRPEGESSPIANLPQAINHPGWLRFEVDGVAQLTGLRGGPYRFRILPEGFAVEPATVELVEGREQTIELRWSRAQ